MHNDLRLGHSSLRHGQGNLTSALASPLLGFKRLLMGAASRFSNQRFVFSLAALAVLGAKFIHIKSHMSALPTVHLVNWGYSFFAQDFVLLIILRLLLGGWLSPGRSSEGLGFWRRVAGIASWCFIGFVIGLNIVGICFFATSGSEIHWSNIGLAGDAAGRALLLTGLFTLAVVFGVMSLVAWALKDFLFVAVGLAADIVSWPFLFAARRRACGPQPHWATYAEVPQHDVEQGTKEGGSRTPRGFDFSNGLEGVKRWPWMWMFWLAAYTAAGVGLGAQVVMCSLRPHDGSLTFMSWTTTLLPFIDFKNSSPNLSGLLPVFGSGIGREWDNRTALADPMPFSWLPKDPIQGFEDWYTNKPHYNASADPLKISNLEAQLLPELRKKLKDVPIRHVVTIVLESTRKDVFPLKHNQINEERLKESWGHEGLPEEVLERLRTLTPVAKFLTGDHDDGFGPKNKKEKSRGGLNFNDAYTTSTYTLKSMTGTLCGVTPLIADFNLEYLHHIYQPCLPHIFGALNTLKKEEKEKDERAFGSYDWKSSFMQSVIMDFDNAGPLMKKIGFPKDRVIDSAYLRSDEAKFGKVDLPNVNYFGMQETPLLDYIRDEFESAKKSNERVFLTHLTSTSHHPYNMPKNETYVPLGRGLDDLSHYLNAIGYDDRWLGKVLDVLDETGVADETLVVLVGDHGLSIPENGILASYYNPNTASNHVPLVLSHPKLPPLTVDDAVSTQQIVPTILDLLVETGSLSAPRSAAAADLARNYEGQSLLRPVYKSLDTGTGAAWDPADPRSREVANWQFTVINPGRAMVGVRDARHRGWRMVVPVVDNIEWRFTDVDADPAEKTPVLGFDFGGFMMKTAEVHGEEAARWAEEAAFMARWFVEENSKRWRYGPYAAY
ncbi:sulfatase [Colletotrichum karsti]|uniref:Sulfatase n=1 Tax=Colletotrichum karsti TaxID=1095194 RepID=A0A9P6HUK5_9PEZI|nr:sulfatase [Colletotrichum karsti]KAF9871493.1 sulfatase [Colletotrichum karsti]